jgi:hypothetical protein
VAKVEVAPAQQSSGDKNVRRLDLSDNDVRGDCLGTRQPTPARRSGSTFVADRGGATHQTWMQNEDSLRIGTVLTRLHEARATQLLPFPE